MHLNNSDITLQYITILFDVRWKMMYVLINKQEPIYNFLMAWSPVVVSFLMVVSLYTQLKEYN
jgi:hypothetical protein